MLQLGLKHSREEPQAITITAMSHSTLIHKIYYVLKQASPTRDKNTPLKLVPEISGENKLIA